MHWCFYCKKRIGGLVIENTDWWRAYQQPLSSLCAWCQCQEFVCGNFTRLHHSPGCNLSASIPQRLLCLCACISVKCHLHSLLLELATLGFLAEFLIGMKSHLSFFWMTHTFMLWVINRSGWATDLADNDSTFPAFWWTRRTKWFFLNCPRKNSQEETVFGKSGCCGKS